MILKRYRFLLPTVLPFLFVASASATTRRVPSDFPTIQAGIDASSSSDTVLVAPGTYIGPGNRLIDFHGKDVVLISEAGATATTIDGEGDQFPSGHPVLDLSPGTTGAARIDGFTITGGRRYGVFSAGAGLTCNGSSPTVANCIIRLNWTGDSPYKQASERLSCGEGGGLFIGNAPSPMRIEDCLIEENGSNCELSGVAVWDSPDVTFERCTIVLNRFIGLSVRNSSVTLKNCTLANTPQADQSGWGLVAGLESTVHLERSVVWANCNGIRIGAGSTVTAVSSLIDTSDVEGVLTLLGENLSTDPLFCDPNPCPMWQLGDPGDYRVEAASPCLPENNPFGVLIGALGSCAATSVPPSIQPPDDAIWVSPNPFSTSTSLSLSSALDRDATLSVFDVAGRRVREFRMTRSAVPVAWDGTDENGQSVAAGTYLLRLEGRPRASGRVTVVR
jgi:Right handed beta helix region/FlgD Ig-like domain